MNTKPRPPFVIISAERADATPARNLQANHELAMYLRLAGYEPIAVDGVYKGAREASWLVHIPADGFTMARLACMRARADYFQQETILYVQWSGRATLIYDHQPEHDVDVGVWHEVEAPRENAVIGDNYTQIGERYYVAS